MAAEIRGRQDLWREGPFYGVAQSRTRLKRLGSGAQTWLGGGGKFVAALTHTVDVPRRGGPRRARLSTAVGAQSSF